MTPERAAYHRLMLLIGLREDFDREMDHALETEDPITAPILDLAFCMSDPAQTVSVLNNYLLDHTVDQQKVYDMVLSELRRQYNCKALDACQVCRVLSKILRICDYGEQWLDIYTYLYAYELLDEGIISREVFVTAFEAVFLREEQIDVWKLHKEHQKKKSFIDFWHKLSRKEKKQ